MYARLFLDPDMGDFSVNPLVLIGVGSGFAFSGLFYHLYQEKTKELKKLKASGLNHSLSHVKVLMQL